MEQTYGINLYNLFASWKIQLLESESITWLVLLCSSTYPFGLWIYCGSRRVTRGGRGGVSPTLFQKLGKSALILGKNALIVVIYGLNFSIKMQFLRVSRKKTEDFSLQGKISFSCCTLLFIKVPKFQENSPALKNSWLRAWVV